MTSDYLAQAVKDIPSLQAVFVTTMPDCLLFDSWVRPGLGWKTEEVASYFGDLFRANRQGLKALNAWSAEMQVTIEAPDQTLLLKELTPDFVCATIFERQAALGMVRLHNQRLLERITASLPNIEVERRPRGVRLVDFLQRYAPDPHAVLLRVSLRSGLPMDKLEAPQGLGPAEVQQLEETARDILGLQTLNI